jgi:DNA gyrase subunit B
VRTYVVAAVDVDVADDAVDDDAEAADQIFSVLMGDEVPPRRKFIQSHAHYAELDI